MSVARAVSVTALRQPASAHKPLIDALLGKVIAVEGLIGSGKSTLARKLESQYPGKVGVYAEQVNEGLLELFYSEPEKYAWALQWGQLKLRLYQLELAKRDAGSSAVSIWDRSMIGDYIFCLLNHLMGTIDSAEMAVYEAEFGSSLHEFARMQFLQHVDALVLLDDEPLECKKRAETRGNASESDIPLGYYDGLDQLHFAVFLRLYAMGGVRLGVLRWGDYDKPEELVRHFCDITHSPSGRVVYTDEPHSDLAVFDCAEQVHSKYKEIRDGGLCAINEYGQRSVAFRVDIMTIDPALLGIQTNGYDLTFYENPYRRVVLYYLRAGATVEFYSGSKS